MSVLILTYEGDPHLPLVQKHLAAAGCRHEVLLTDVIGYSTRPSVRIDCAGSTITRLGVDLSEVHAVWNRRVIANPGWSTDPMDDPMMEQHIHDQRMAFLDGLLSMVPAEARWVNTIESRLARSKVYQLRTAQELRIAVPETLVSSDPEEIRDFAADRKLITKLVSPTPSRVPQGETQFSIFTTRIDPASIPDGQLSSAEAIYQAEVPKRREARAIVIGDRVVTCGFDTQRSESTSLDWRRYDFDSVPHYPLDLPDEFAAQLIALTRRLGLVYSAIDVAQRPDGSWLFFELNPAGQWAWLEELGKVPVGKAIAECLMQS